MAEARWRRAEAAARGLPPPPPPPPDEEEPPLAKAADLEFKQNQYGFS